MAKTVDTYSTIENFRTRYNELATDVGEKTGLRTAKTGTIIDAINSVEDKSFFFQEFIYTPSSATTAFSGADAFQNTLSFRKDRIQVFHIDASAGTSKHLLEGDDYSVGGLSASTNLYATITLSTAAQNNDRVVIYSYTGSYLGTAAGGSSQGHFDETAAKTIHNTNDSGIILNGDASGDRRDTLQGGYNIQLAGKTYAEDDITLAAGKTLSAPTLTNGTVSITTGVGTGFTALTSTQFNGALVGNVTGNVSGSSGTVTSISGHSINGLSDVVISGASSGQVLSHDGSNWVNQAAAQTYTNEMAQDAVGSIMTGGTGISVAYNDAANTITITNDNTADITGITAGSGLGGSALTGPVPTLSVNIGGIGGVKVDASDNVILDYETTSTAPTAVGSTSTGHLWFVI
jgi:hypothetical protein